jgi:hypothetical protein
MESPESIVCRQCHGVNDPAGRYCWYCGAKLRGRKYNDGHRTAGQIVGTVFKWLISLAVLVGVLGGVYYAFDRYLLPAFKDEAATQSSPIGTIVTTTSSSTTTTTIPRSDRLVSAGSDRYGTAVAISKFAFPSGATGLIIVPGDEYSGVAATSLAAAYGGPVLLLPPEGLTDDIRTEMQRLKPAQVFLVGVARPNTLAKQIRNLLQDAEVTPLVGDDQYQTAALVAAKVKEKLGTVTKVVVVPLDSFVEGVAVAPVAAANGWPILLTSKEDKDLPDSTSGAIKELGATSALIVGSNAEVPLTDVDRQVGADSYETALMIVRWALEHGSTFAYTAIASGDAFPDGLASGAYVAQNKGILLLAQNGKLTSGMLTLFNSNVKSIRTLDFVALPSLATSLGNPSTTTSAPGTSGTGTTSETGTTRATGAAESTDTTD